MGDERQIKQLTTQELQQLLSDPQQLNSYSYARNNPLVFVDPNGEFSISWNDYKIGLGVAWNLIKSGAQTISSSARADLERMNSPGYQQKSIDAAKQGMVYAGEVNGKDTYIGFGVGSIKSIGGPNVANGLQLGQQFGKLGKVIENASGKITGIFTRSNGDEHALGRILNRSASINDIASTVYNPLATRKQRVKS